MTKETNAQFIKVNAPQEYEIIHFPKHILYDSTLSGNAVRLIQVMIDYGNRPKWQLWQNHLIKCTCLGYTAYDTAIKNLISSGYVKRTREKIKGKWQPYKYEFSAFPIFKTEEKQEPKQEQKLKQKKEKKPVRFFQTGTSKLENPNYTINNDNLRLEKKNDNDTKQESNDLQALDNRSSSFQDSIDSFDFRIYKFPDGTSISARMQNGFKKYTQEQSDKLQATIFFFEADIARGKKPKTSYEQMLQGYINGKYAEKSQNIKKNGFYAKYLTLENNHCQIKILKTVVQYRPSSSDSWESLDLDLPCQTFGDILDNFIRKMTEK